MAGVLEQFLRLYPRRAELCESGLAPINPRAQQLQEAKKILAEVLGIDISEVEEMIKSRMVERSWHEEELWPEMLWIES